VATGGDAPFVQDDLVGADAGAAPFGVRGDALQGLDVEVEHRTVDRHRVLHSHHELDVERRDEPALLRHVHGAKNVAEVEGLDLWLYAVGAHLVGQPVDQIRAVLVDPGRKIVRTHCERGHVGAVR
jgi:hypothetical protein